MSEPRMVVTTRFGEFTVSEDQIWTFPLGLIGLPTARKWLLLGESEQTTVAWLQSVDEPELSLPLVSPRRYLRNYRARLASHELAPLGLGDDDLLFVLTTVATTGSMLTTDLRAPLLFNASRHLGLQAVALDELPLQYVLPLRTDRLKRSA